MNFPNAEDGTSSHLSAKDNSADEQGNSPQKSPSAKTIEAWLISQLAEQLGLEPEEVDVRESFASYGLSSREAVILSGDLEVWLNRRLPATLAWDYPNIETLAKHLAGESEPSAPEVKTLIVGSSEREPLAIIGLGCRFPGAQNPQAYWQLLRDGVDAVREVPAERWSLKDFYDPDNSIAGKINTRWGGFLENVDQFDSRFFGISPREATRIDPQQRLLMEVAWEAFEDAGQTLEQLAGTRTGVFVGISNNDYSRIQFGDPMLIDAYAGTGNAFSIAANRLSYLFDLQGPSMAVDTACSSSLVSVHLACQSLWSGETTLAIAGGANLILSPEVTINFTKAGALSPDGRCKAFDAEANGFVRSEGVGLVVLKPLSKALADGDRVYALILGSAINQDGRTNGLMAPNQSSQEAVLREAYRRAGVSPGQVQYVEAHGTGTLLGDPIEVKALGAVLATERAAENKCYIGSVKTNLGHLESAAGVAGLIKLALSLKHQQIPPSLHFSEPNPYIPFDELPLSVPQTLTDWPKSARPAVGGVSSFGFGGTNAHLVLSQAPETFTSEQACEPESLRPELFPLSARTPESLQSQARAFRNFLTGEALDKGVSFRDVCHSARVRRTHHDYRLAVVAHSPEELAGNLEAFLNGEERAGMVTGRRNANRTPKLVFVFSGHGSQWLGMGRELLQQESVFREVLEQCDALMNEHTDWSLLHELCAEEAESRLDELDVIQPAVFAIQVALAALWRSWGIEPDAVVGHSMGEVAAAYVAGALSLKDAVRVICLRSQLMKRVSGQGAMAVVELPLDQARQLVAAYDGRVSTAVSNSPISTVLSGEQSALEEILKRLEEQGVFCRFVKIDVASHSSQVEPLHADLLEALNGISPQPYSLSFYSAVDGALRDEPLDAAYWWRNLREPVLFSTAIRHSLEDGHSLFLELSPHPSLSIALADCFKYFEHDASVLPSMRRSKEELGVLLGSLGALYTNGHPFDWTKLSAKDARYVQLPNYQFKRERYWLEPAESCAPRQANGTGFAASLPQASQHDGSLTLQPEEPELMNQESHLQNVQPSTPHEPSPARKEKIFAEVQSIVGRLLEVNPSEIDAHTPFLEIGADSILLIEAIRTIENTYGVKLSIRQLFEELTTVDALVSYIDQTLPPEQPSQTTPETPAALPLQVQVAPPAPLAVAPLVASAQTVQTEALADSINRGAGAETMLERVMTQQLNALSQVISQQLNVLGQSHTTNGNGLPHSTPTMQSASQPTPAVAAQATGDGHHAGNGNGHHSDNHQQAGNGHQQAAQVSSNGNHNAPVMTATPATLAPAQNGAQGVTPAPFVPFQKITPGKVGGFSPRQQQHLDALIERYNSRTKKSKEMTQAYRPVLSDNRASAGFRLSIKEMLYPIISERSEGSKIWDVDGNEYLDITMGFGVNLFGHNAPFIKQALQEQLERGIQLGPQSHLAGEVAQLICEQTGMDRVTFCNSGTEAVMTALRLARAATGRTKVAMFSSSYHGSFDGVLASSHTTGQNPGTVPMAPGVPAPMVEDVLVLDYGTTQALETIRAHAHELAAVLIEPVQSRRPDFQPKEFLQQVRALTREAGTALIFDEVITGFRIHPGGAQAWFGVQADLASYGKIIGGGLPIGIVAGRTAFMNGIDGGTWTYGDSSYPQAETTFFAGTFCKHPLAMAASRAVLKEIKKSGTAIQDQLNRRTAQLADTLNAYFEQEQLSIRIIHFGSLFRFAFSGNLDVLFYHLMEKGIYIWEGRNCFLSTAHTDEDIERFVRAVKESIDEMRDGDFLPPPPNSPNGQRPSHRRSSTSHNGPSHSLSKGGGSSSAAALEYVAQLSEPDVFAFTQPAEARVVPLTEAQKQLWFLS
ncbi:MAG: aminotransferase class III-fold pyridoxal phosphate-dependent enzyme, partial [Pyrinomonadaceae bacterium]